MNWSKGYSARYYAMLVDPSTLGDVESYEIVGGTVKFESSNLRTSADLDCVDYSYTEEKLIRIWLDAKQEGEPSGHVALFTGYTSSPDIKIDGAKTTSSLECYSVLLPAYDILLDRGWYAPVEADGLVLIQQLLRVCNVPIVVSSTEDKNRNLTQSIVAESGETHLSMVEKLLAAINWRMWVDGYGRIHVQPYSETPVASIDSRTNDILETDLTISYNWFECPNVIRANQDDDYAIAKDYDSDTPMSITNRGREVWYEENDVALNDGETLQEFAIRRLNELQRVSKTISYQRRFQPNINVSDAIILNYPKQNITGKYLVTSQSIELGFNAQTSEEVIKL